MDYKDKLKLAKEALDSGSYDKETIEYIFPELTESEDEKIRKWIINEIKIKHHNLNEDDVDFVDKAIAWLEKQDKQGSLNTNQECLKEIKRVQEYQDLSDWEKKFDNIASMYAHNKNQEGYNNSWYVKERAAEILYHAKKELEKQGEQNLTPPKWRYKKDSTSLLKDSIVLNKYGCVAKLPSGAIVSDVWVLDYSELAKLPKEELEVEQKHNWDEEDERMFKSLNKLLNEASCYSCTDGVDKILAWLKRKIGR